MADVLLLNADGNPVSYMPLSTLTWEDAIKYMVLDKADVLMWHDNWIVGGSGCVCCHGTRADSRDDDRLMLILDFEF